MEEEAASDNKPSPSCSKQRVNFETDIEHIDRLTWKVIQEAWIDLNYFNALKPGSNFERANVLNQDVEAQVMLIGPSASQQQRAMADAIAENGEFSG
ncbi:hypothetical protein WI560_25130 [Bradyrhizobium sp. A11]|uniref:hypothetical protein n=1 Tax=Bradyrhizobium sp. A11 TaxID=3133974 RepID=UPI0032483CE6